MRIRTFDLARGFTVLLIAPIHTMMLYSQPAVHGTLLGKLFQFIAEGPGAQLFMMLMGIFFKPNKNIFQKAFFLLISAYVLNIVKFIVPYAMLPASFRSLLPGKMLDIILIGDILHFAALALIILFLVSYLAKDPRVPLVLATIVTFISPLLWDIHDNNIFINHLLELAGGQPPQTYFPLFPWLVYPLTGMTIRYYSKEIPNFKYIGTFLIITGTFLDDGRTISFYRTYPSSTLIHLGIVLLTLYAWHLYDTYVKPNHFTRLLTYMSHNITVVYITQWIIIAWMLPAIGYQTLNFFYSILAILFTSSLTLLITAIINFFHDR